ncbi:hypothetical protein ES708_09283 [subsurface metagenome]
MAASPPATGVPSPVSLFPPIAWSPEKATEPSFLITSASLAKSASLTFAFRLARVATPCSAPARSWGFGSRLADASSKVAPVILALRLANVSPVCWSPARACSPGAAPSPTSLTPVSSRNRSLWAAAARNHSQPSAGVPGSEARGFIWILSPSTMMEWAPM